MSSGSTESGCRVARSDIERMIPFELLLDRIAEERSSEWIAVRRFLHSHPEPSGDEIGTTQLIAERLVSLGMVPDIPGRGVGVIADLKIGSPTADAPIVAIRADIDA